MKHGFVKVAAVTAPITVADCHKNAKGIIETANKLKEDNIELILFPELSLTSSSCGDLYTQPHLIQTCREAIEQIAEETSKSDAIIVVGAPVEHRNSLYNCAVVIHKGDVKGIVPKHHLDNHKGEGRWFTSGGELPLESHTTIGGKKVPFVKSGIFSTMTYSFGIEIGGEANTPAAPGAGLVAAGAQIILNPAAEHTFAGAQKQTQRRIAEQSARYRSGYV